MDLIDRQAAIEVADAVWIVTGDKNVAKVWDQIKDLPFAQPQRKTGRWIYDEERCATGIYAICSACNESIYQTGNFRYCPNCGARMEGTE